VVVEEFSELRGLGRVALRDGGHTLAVGIITRVLEEK
jgi:elongation factor 1 alpha-like protein